MGKRLSERLATIEAGWYDRVTRHASSGQSVMEFCRNESISVASFYQWRKRMQSLQCDPAGLPEAEIRSPVFIELGTMRDLPLPSVQQPVSALRTPALASLDVQLDLGGGLVLRILRH